MIFILKREVTTYAIFNFILRVVLVGINVKRRHLKKHQDEENGSENICVGYFFHDANLKNAFALIVK